jgi:hypothetical protein
MAGSHPVKAGECIGSIAYAYGIPWEEVWNHPQNRELKQTRGDPNVLKVGDVLFIPDYKPKPHVLATGKRHRIVYQRPRAKLRLRVVVDPGPPPSSAPPSGPPSADTKNVTAQDPEPDGEARADDPRKALAYTLFVEGETIEGTTDADGYVDCDIPPGAMRGRLVLAPGTPHETEIKLQLGHLDPIDEVSGIKQRLRNLCFDCGDQTDEETPEFASALRAFQSKHALKATGTLDDQTRAEILKVHGS